VGASRGCSAWSVASFHSYSPLRSQENQRKTGVPFLNTPLIITNNTSGSTTSGGTADLQGDSLDPPQLPPSLPESQLASVDALPLSDDSPVEQELPVTPAADEATDEHEVEPKLTPAPLSKENMAYSYPPPPTGEEEDGRLPYPVSTPHLTRAPVEILCKDPAYGRGVFAPRDIGIGEVVEVSPVLVLNEEEYKGRKKGEEDDGTLRGVEASQLRGYVFTWGRDGSMAVALGLGSSFLLPFSFDLTDLIPLSRLSPQSLEQSQHLLLAQPRRVHHLIPRCEAHSRR
jgi:hypothetical protein